MADSTVNYGFPYPTGGDAVAVHSDIEKVAKAVDAVELQTNLRIDQVNTALDGKRDIDPTTLGLSSVLDNLQSGTYTIWSGDVAEALELPIRTQGSLEVVRWGVSGGTATFTARSTVPQTWVNSRLSGGWVGWTRVGGSVGTVKALQPAAAGTLKTAPLAFTTGYGGAVTSGTGTTKVVQYVNANVSRAQVHIRNWNPRYVNKDRAAATLTGVRIGRHTSNGGGTDWVNLTSGATEYQSGWITVPAALRGAEVVIEYTWSGSDVTRTLGTAWEGGSRTNAPALWTWLEVEVPASVPVVAAFGSSTAAGVGATRPMIDSWLAQWCKTNNAIPAFWAQSGDSASSWTPTADRKWSLYGDDIAAPDAMLYAMGSNDWAGGASLAELQERITSTTGEISKRITANIFGTTVTPRRVAPGNDSTRTALNAWMSTSGLFRDVFDFAGAVALPDGALDPAVDADGTHVNTLGHARLAAAVDRPILSSAGGAPTVTYVGDGVYEIK